MTECRGQTRWARALFAFSHTTLCFCRSFTQMPLTVELPQSPPSREIRVSSRARETEARTPLRAAAAAEEAGAFTPFLSPQAHTSRYQRVYLIFISCM